MIATLFARFIRIISSQQCLLCLFQLEDVEDEKKNADRVKAAVMENVAMDFVSCSL